MPDELLPIAAKAARLIREGQVSFAPGMIYLVQGDHGMYTVAIIDTPRLKSPVPFCSCPSQQDLCSHGAAALLFHKELKERST